MVDLPETMGPLLTKIHNLHFMIFTLILLSFFSSHLENVSSLNLLFYVPAHDPSDLKGSQFFLL